ncbi:MULTISPECIES: hypothetical protein [unclassified Bradyrhizobium]|uniref:hypothetical protein n=1 Tax=unclassified Bradyrhizobium TaxID=2631580 RepID=UPI00247A9A58|nr:MULTISPECIES: hypothetical protein [unclassified Bradyrhizobium]WGS21277.1 hypothetical protein MTX22_05930 [Bradyrhizobium sp. ISRA463]WGS28204.1 hypothetical protein MTX19_03775 [Bradyrhizobium sp. ISRA464]
MTASRSSAFAIAAVTACLELAPVTAHAQWWRSGPKDFEDCADIAEKAKTKEDKTAQLGECNAKFAGRRKPGGGYTYYDFMQDRSFDIAGPNPTRDEQKKIDQEYTVYLEKQRRSNIVAAFNAKQLQQEEKLQQEQQQQQPPQQQAQHKRIQVTMRSEPVRVPVPVASPVKQAARIRAAHCAKNSFSCEWPRLSQSLDDLKKLFTFQPSTPGRPAKRS